MRHTLLACLLALLVGASWCAAPAAAQPWAAAPASSAESATSTAEPEAPSGPSLRGTLRDGARTPVPDATVTVTGADGGDVGTATSDAEGAWEVPVPSGGTYTVTLDTTSLPEGVTLATEGGQTREVQVRPGARQGVIFQLQGGEGTEGDDEEPDAGSSGGGSSVLQLLVEGVKFGSIIAITAVGLSLVFGTTRLINFAHGEFVTVGAVSAYWLSTRPGDWPIILAAVGAMAFTAAMAGGFELALWRPLRRRGAGLIQMFIVAIGLSLLLRHLVLVLFGAGRGQYDQYTLQRAWEIGPVRITPRDLVITVLALLVLVLVAVMLQRTRIGKAMRAVNDNADLAEASGIDVQRVILIVWVIGGGLAGLGGVFFGLTQAVYYDMGFRLLLLMFAGVILGGLGSAYGAMLGSLLIGVISQVSTLWFPPSLQYMWALLVMILVLLVRPQGLLGRRERVG